MTTLKNKTVLVRDHGLFHCLAERMARDFKEVFYFRPWEESFPLPDKYIVGQGIPGLTRVDNFEDYQDKVDLICFFDIYSGALQEKLRKDGHRVFGTGKGEILELDRIKFREILKREGLPVIKHKVITGLDALREHLKPLKDKWIKFSKFRGIKETFHFKDYFHSRYMLDEIAVKAGVYQDLMRFIVEDPLKGVEAAADWFVVDGKHLSAGMWGYENKDSGYIGKASTFEGLPEPIMDVCLGLEDVMGEYDVRGMVSLETRIAQDGDPYCIDPCMRGPSPPAELMCEMYENFSEIVWGVAGGEEIEPKMKAKYGAEVLLKSDLAREAVMAVSLKEEDREFLKFRNLCRIDGQYYHIPGDKETLIGAAIGMGDTLEEAQGNALEMCEKVQAEDVFWNKAVFDELDDTLDKAKKIGLVKF
jgi:hypothetical protein